LKIAILKRDGPNSSKTKERKEKEELSKLLDPRG
jgi:hypothetical protein